MQSQVDGHGVSISFGVGTTLLAGGLGAVLTVVLLPAAFFSYTVRGALPFLVVASPGFLFAKMLGGIGMDAGDALANWAAVVVTGAVFAMYAALIYFARDRVVRRKRALGVTLAHFLVTVLAILTM